MATHKYAEENIKAPNYSTNGQDNIPSSLQPSVMIDDDLLRARGLYSKSEIEEAKYSRFSRFGRVLNPYGRLTDCREYLFFTKPDLHICAPAGNLSDPVYKISSGSGNDSNYKANGLVLNPQLSGNSYFVDLIGRHPNVVKELQSSAVALGSSIAPFGHLLSFSVNSYLELPGSEASTLDNSSTIFGTSYEYLKDSEESDENPSFSLDFLDTKDLECYHFFKAYSEYHIARKSGLVTPPNLNYYRYKRLHNTMGVYKFIVAEDMETIIYWAYFWGVYPISCPRDAFGDPLFSDGLSFSINFKAAFMEDMNPAILKQFNNLMMPVLNNNGLNKDRWLPVVRQNHTSDILYGSNHSYDTELGSAAREETIAGSKYYLGITDIIDGTLPKAALVDGRIINNENPKYRLRWYG